MYPFEKQCTLRLSNISPNILVYYMIFRRLDNDDHHLQLAIEHCEPRVCAGEVPGNLHDCSTNQDVKFIGNSRSI